MKRVLSAGSRIDIPPPKLGNHTTLRAHPLMTSRNSVGMTVLVVQSGPFLAAVHSYMSMA